MAASHLPRAQAVFRELTGVLGLRLESTKATSQDIAPFVELLIELRAELRKAKQFQLADSLRDTLSALGITLKDGPGGTVWEHG